MITGTRRGETQLNNIMRKGCGLAVKSAAARILFVSAFLLSSSDIASADGGACRDVKSGLTGISSGLRYSCVLTKDGNVRCQGFDNGEEYGQIVNYSGGDAIGVAARRP